MNNNKKIEKEYNPGIFMKNFITVQILILYLVFEIGDIISRGIDDPERIITRIIPVGIIAFVSTFFSIRKSAKKCKKSEEQDMRKNIFIAPLIVAIIVLVYGLYSVHSNVKKLEKELGLYIAILGEEKVMETLEEAEDEAKMTWTITAVIYFVGAGAAAFLNKNKLNELMKDEPEMPQFNEVVSSEEQPPIQSEQKEEQQEQVNNIKWDL